jgi:RNA-directed DNA polymerase
MDKLKLKLIGYYRYYGITDNFDKVNSFNHLAIKLIFKWLNRRSQRKSYTWEKFNIMIKYFNIPRAKVYVSIFKLKEEITYIL